MKTLTLLRHAKSGWDDAVPRDFDRPLNGKGRRAAAMIGRYLRAQKADFDHVVASPAVRVVETLDDVLIGYGRPLLPVWDRRIYMASAATLLEIVRDLPPTAQRVLLVGHNPGLEDLALMLVPEGTGGARAAVEEKYPTASLAELTFDVDAWGPIGPETGTFASFVRPRDLDPSLGPDAD